MRRVVVTGGSGFIGTNLVEHFLMRGEPVLSLDPRAPVRDSHRPYWRFVDPLNDDAISGALSSFRATHVLHFGARTDLHGSALLDYDSNIRGVSRMIEAVRNTPTVQKVMFASSRMVCDIRHKPVGDEDYSPPNAYGESKVVGELLVRAAALDVPWTIVRPTSIWGPGFDVPYKTFFLTIARGRYFHVGTGHVRKSFGFVLNTVHQIDRLLETDTADVHGKTFSLGDYPPIDIAEMAHAIQSRLDAPPIRRLPRAALEPIAKAGDLLRAAGWREPPLTTFRLNNLTTEMVFDLSPLERIVGPLPYTMEEGVDLTIDWLRARGEV